MPAGAAFADVCHDAGLLSERRTPMSQTQWEPLDFDALYRRAADERAIPWDIGGPQPSVIMLERDGRIRGEVLDAGCGVGGNAIFLARRGHRVTGVDSAADAIAIAKRDAERQGADVDFTVADAVTLPGYDGRFDTVVDSALFHVLDGEQQQRYIQCLHRVTQPGAMLAILCLSEQSPLPGIDEATLRATLAPLWPIAEIRRTEYNALVGPELVATFPAASELPTDEHGQHLLPAWLVRADRAN